MRAILRTLTALAAPAGSESKLSIFYFHRVLAKPDPLLAHEPDAVMFDKILGWIGSQFRVLDPLEACDRLCDGSLPSRPAVITFDDGYRDNYMIALPILRCHGMRAAFFVATGFLNGGIMFNDRIIEAIRRTAATVLWLPMPAQGEAVSLSLGSETERRLAIENALAAVKYLPPEERLERVAEIEFQLAVPPLKNLMMNGEEVVALHRAGMRLGGHTRSHPILSGLDESEARAEIEGGLQDLRDLTGEFPRLFAYPNGKHGYDFDSIHAAMVSRAGCTHAFTTGPGVADRHSDPFELPRFTPWDRTRLRFELRALRNVSRR